MAKPVGARSNGKKKRGSRKGLPARQARRVIAELRGHNLAEIGRALGLTRQAVAGWRVIPAEWVKQTSSVTGIPVWRLRPDLYDAPPPPVETTTDAAG